MSRISAAGGISRPPAALLIWLTLALALAGCGAPWSVASGATTVATATPLAAIPLPPMLGAYHIFTADLLTGDIASLGAQTVNVSRSVHGVGLSPGGHWLYVTDVSGNRLVAYRLQGGRLTDERAVPVGAYPVHMAETLDRRFIFVTNFYGASVSVVSTQTWRVVKTIATPRSPHGIVLSPDGRYAYVASYLGHAIAVLDVATQALIATISFPAQAQPYGLAISPDGRYVYASDNFSGRLYVVDTAARRLITGVPIGQRPALIARSPDGHTLYVANGASRSVSVLDIGSHPAAPRVIATVPVSGNPHGLAVTPDGRYIVVADTASGQLSIIDALTNQVIATVSGLRYPNDAIATAA
jgi:YVTN family beta-propeller protein